MLHVPLEQDSLSDDPKDAVRCLELEFVDLISTMKGSYPIIGGV